VAMEVEVAPPTTTATGNGSAQLFARINHTATATTTANTCENKSNNSQKPSEQRQKSAEERHGHAYKMCLVSSSAHIPSHGVNIKWYGEAQPKIFTKLKTSTL